MLHPCLGAPVSVHPLCAIGLFAPAIHRLMRHNKRIALPIILLFFPMIPSALIMLNTISTHWPLYTHSKSPPFQPIPLCLCRGESIAAIWTPLILSYSGSPIGANGITDKCICLGQQGLGNPAWIWTMIHSDPMYSSLWIQLGHKNW